MSSTGQLLCYRSVVDLWPLTFTCSQFCTCRESQTLFNTLLETDFLYMDTFQTVTFTARHFAHAQCDSDQLHRNTNKLCVKVRFSCVFLSDRWVWGGADDDDEDDKVVTGASLHFFPGPKGSAVASPAFSSPPCNLSTRFAVPQVARKHRAPVAPWILRKAQVID